MATYIACGRVRMTMIGSLSNDDDATKDNASAQAQAKFTIV